MPEIEKEQANTPLDLSILKAYGFKKDMKCAPVNNRWEFERMDGKVRDAWISITLTVDGSKAKYGVANFHSIEYGGIRPYLYISKHRSFKGPITIEDFKAFIQRKTDWIGNRNF